MKIEATRSKVTVTLTLDADEAIQIYQLAGQVHGTSVRARFYTEACTDLMNALFDAGVQTLPLGTPLFEIQDGKFTALDCLRAEAKAETTLERVEAER